MMELEQLRQLVAFAEQGTLSRAAEELHISQPSLSRTMQALEEELQASLFIRQKNRIVLNEVGQVAVEYARQWAPVTLMLTSRPSRTEANALYRTAGFGLKTTNVYRMDITEK